MCCQATHGETAASWSGYENRASVTAGDGPTHRGGQRAAEFGGRKYSGSLAEQLWDHLQTIDFIDRAVTFAATLLLCLFPFMIVASGSPISNRRGRALSTSP
jgi:hypothetical protein